MITIRGPVPEKTQCVDCDKKKSPTWDVHGAKDVYLFSLCSECMAKYILETYKEFQNEP